MQNFLAGFNIIATLFNQYLVLARQNFVDRAKHGITIKYKWGLWY